MTWALEHWPELAGAGIGVAVLTSWALLDWRHRRRRRARIAKVARALASVKRVSGRGAPRRRG